ncbi:N-acetyltransferase [Arthrobacter crystallopoietes BAB-32]|uniref:N-acetyltransferase n=1 Tax=Arthrobacter crystallopoietes BAB-32 TaxID=1246476 RepID=N1UZR6_9MICC|nr:GNAT family protein [Arthrobacter crystallopoietes]EMY34565.1 N-acetyltransferase [Arthrobacter crystallopoietes BAB-32]
MPLFEPLNLTGKYVRLQPLQRRHMADLEDAVRDGELWNLWYTRVPSPETMELEIRRRMEKQDQGTMVPFTIRRLADEAALGMTTFCNIDADTPRVEIGYTWLRASAQGSGANADCKMLLMTHAFEQLGCRAVEFRTHWMNHPSRAAIERLGAKQDGVLRNHTRMPDGTVRDTVVYSVLDTEWPIVKRGLQARLDKPRQSGSPTPGKGRR